MKKFLLLFIGILLMTISFTQTGTPLFVAKDIDNFWTAYEKIISAKDSAQQYNYLKQLYLDKGTPGLKSLIEVRQYTNKEFIDAIYQYPRFWNSFKANTANISDLYPEIKADIEKLREVYPALTSNCLFFYRCFQNQ